MTSLEIFTHVRVLVGVVLGLGLTRILAGLARFMQHPAHKKLYATHLLWVAVVLLYWSVTAPRRFSLLTAFWMGIALDLLSGSLLGQHALALLVIVYIAERLHLLIRVFPLSQLGLTVLALLGLYEFILFWIDGVAGVTFWFPAKSHFRCCSSWERSFLSARCAICNIRVSVSYPRTSC